MRDTVTRQCPQTATFEERRVRDTVTRQCPQTTTFEERRVKDTVTRQCPQTTTFEERRAEAEPNWGPSAYQPHALLVGQTGWHHQNSFLHFCTCIFSQENFARLLVVLLGAHTLQNPCSDSKVFGKRWSVCVGPSTWNCALCLMIKPPPL